MQFRLLIPLLALSLLLPFGAAIAKKPIAPGALTLPLAGTVADIGDGLGAGKFSGTVTINRFARQSDGRIVAVGIARGSVTTLGGQVVKSGLDTVVMPVRTGLTPAGFSIPRSSEPRLVPVSATQAAGGRFVPTQASCGILHLDIGGTAVNLLGLNVMLSPITLDISGDTAGPLGALVCEIVALLGTVADIVGLLNDLLGLLTGLLGGVVGGIGG
jgi:hypothetical protein